MQVLEKECWSSSGNGNLSNAASICLMRSKWALFSDPRVLTRKSAGANGANKYKWQQGKGGGGEVASLSPDIPTSTNEHAGQASPQSICPDVSVEMDAEDQGGVVDEVVRVR